MANTIVLCKNLEQSILDVSAGIRAQVSEGLLLQGYTLSVLAQPNIALNIENLRTHQDNINARLTSARRNASQYLDSFQPQIIRNLISLESYFHLQQALPTACPPGATSQQWAEAMRAVRNEALSHRQAAINTQNALTSFSNNVQIDINHNVSGFTKIVNDLDETISGKRGTLEQVNDEIESLRKKINGSIAGVVLSSLGIAGGTLMIIIGSVASFASAEIVLAGICLVTASVGGLIPSAIYLSSHYKQMKNIMTDKSRINSELSVANSLRVGYKALGDSAKAADNAAQRLSQAWGTLHDNIGDIISQLESGVVADTDELRTQFIKMADGNLAQAINQASVIREQIAGIEETTAPAGTAIHDAIRNAVA